MKIFRLKIVKLIYTKLKKNLIKLWRIFSITDQKKTSKNIKLTKIIVLCLMILMNQLMLEVMNFIKILSKEVDIEDLELLIYVIILILLVPQRDQTQNIYLLRDLFREENLKN